MRFPPARLCSANPSSPSPFTSVPHPAEAEVLPLCFCCFSGWCTHPMPAHALATQKHRAKTHSPARSSEMNHKTTLAKLRRKLYLLSRVCTFACRNKMEGKSRKKWLKNFLPGALKPEMGDGNETMDSAI